MPRSLWHIDVHLGKERKKSSLDLLTSGFWGFFLSFSFSLEAIPSLTFISISILTSEHIPVTIMFLISRGDSESNICLCARVLFSMKLPDSYACWSQLYFKGSLVIRGFNKLLYSVIASLLDSKSGLTHKFITGMCFWVYTSATEGGKRWLSAKVS